MHEPYPIPVDLDISTWLEPRTALALVQPRFFGDVEGALGWIVERLRAKRVTAVAASVRMNNRDYTRVYMPAEYWEHWAYLAPSVMEFWNGGDITLWSASKALIGRFFDVRFDPKDFESFTPKVAPVAEIAPTPAPEIGFHQPENKKVGAPRKGWWDDLWIEVMCRIGTGVLNADSAPSGSQLEFVLLDIAKELGFSPGESTLKPMALKLFKYLKEVGGK